MASMATVMVPADLMAAGTVAAMAALVAWAGMTVVGSAAVVAVVDEALVVEDDDELLEHAAAVSATTPTAASVSPLRIPNWSILITVCPPRVELLIRGTVCHVGVIRRRSTRRRCRTRVRTAPTTRSGGSMERSPAPVNDGDPDSVTATNH